MLLNSVHWHEWVRAQVNDCFSNGFHLFFERSSNNYLNLQLLNAVITFYHLLKLPISLVSEILISYKCLPISGLKYFIIYSNLVKTFVTRPSKLGSRAINTKKYWRVIVKQQQLLNRRSLLLLLNTCIYRPTICSKMIFNLTMFHV